jgi:hypothetical protein
MPDRFHVLARYNGEQHRGITHTPKMDAEMAVLQADFYVWQRSKIEAEAAAKGMVVVEVEGGGLLTCPPGTYKGGS